MKKHLVYLLALWGLTFLNAQAAKVPEEAKKHLAFGAAALEMAQSDDGFKKAAVEFEAAANLAPQWPAPYYNLGVVYSKLEDWEDALANYNKYLELAPKAKDAEAVKSEIYKIQYKKEQLFDLGQFQGFYNSEHFSLAFRDLGKGHGRIQITCQSGEDYVLWNEDVELKEDKQTGRMHYKAMFNEATNDRMEKTGEKEVYGYFIPTEKNPNGETWAVAQFQYHNEGWIFEFKMDQKN